MTTPRDPGRSVRGGEPPRRRPDGAPPGPPGEERWTPEDRLLVERQPRGGHRDELDGWQPQARRRRPIWASAALAALLAAVLVLLVIAATVLPGLGGAAPSVEPSASASPTLVAASESPTPSPSPTPTPSATPLPSVLEVQVRAGDSLNSIAAEYNTKARSIAFWNRDRYPSLDPESEAYEPDRIQIGWMLVVYPGQTYDESGASASPSGAPGGSAAASPAGSP